MAIQYQNQLGSQAAKPFDYHTDFEGQKDLCEVTVTDNLLSSSVVSFLCLNMDSEGLKLSQGRPLQHHQYTCARFAQAFLKKKAVCGGT